MKYFSPKRYGASLAVALLALLAGCNDNEKKLAGASEFSGGLWSLSFSSPAFRNGEAIPKKYTVDADNISPPLIWSAGPDKTREFVLIVEDPDVKAKEPFVHWVAYHLPASSRGLPEGAGRVGVWVGDHAGEQLQGIARAISAPNPRRERCTGMCSSSSRWMPR